jgi:hypothetical protein
MQFFKWIADNWQAVCAWATGIYLVYHIGRLFVSLVLAINAVSSRFRAAETILSTMASNHLPHIQAEIKRGIGVLEDVREDFRKFLKIEDDE